MARRFLGVPDKVRKSRGSFQEEDTVYRGFRGIPEVPAIECYAGFSPGGGKTPDFHLPE